MGLLAFLLWPKKAAAGQLPATGTPQPLPPGPANWVQGEMQIAKGSDVKLKLPLVATVSNAVGTARITATVPAGTTIHIDGLDNQGTIFFIYNNRPLSSPVEDYSDKV